MSDTRVLLVSPDEYEVLRTALLNQRMVNATFIKGLKNTGGTLREVAERRITVIDELMERMVLTNGGKR